MVWLKRVLLLVSICVLAALLFPITVRLWFDWRYAGQIYSRVDDVPSRPVAIVLGAGLWADGSVTPVLADRVATAADLYHAGKVQKLLCTGDNRFVDYNEPQAMADYAVGLGVPREDIVLDYAGRRTYDSCYRANAIFGVSQGVIVTQRFHVPRSLFLCNALGVDSVAITADRRQYTSRRFIWEAREYPALILAWWDVFVRRPTPVLGDPLPIEFATPATEGQ
ncbi:MAG: DUF218 domain-containing protein [Chloroflexi bacterium]|nr:DUF218 domain-containing protein [Chloroflexota bacterium]